MRQRFASEIESFAGLWRGGYYEGDPSRPTSLSNYYGLGYISVLYAVHQVCIKPHVTPDTRVVEIGPGRGAWTKTMTHAKELWCLDVLSPEHNGFWNYVGRENRDHVRYLQVQDFSCSALPNDYFDFFFSFGTFCHITWDSQQRYYRSIFRKLKHGARCFVMFADFDKYNRAVNAWYDIQVWPIKPFNMGRALRWIRRWYRPHILNKSDDNIEPAKWYHAGTNETARALKEIGYTVFSPDIDLIPRDPIAHFGKE